MADVGETVTVGVGVPEGWTPDVTPHLEVAWDGTPVVFAQGVVYGATLRIVARAKTTTTAKRLASLAQGLLTAHSGGGGITSFRPLTGPLPARDPDTRAELCSVTLRATARAVTVPESS
jgi:hypothetical protein